jgi:uncharacterized protein
VIFVDTSFWIGLSDDRDDRHATATALLQAHPASALLTTNHVVGETWTFLCSRHSHTAAMGFLDRVERTSRLETVSVAADLEHRAWEWLRRHDERAYSFVDATSFALMRHRRIGEALAFDGDFAAAGFVELRP